MLSLLLIPHAPVPVPIHATFHQLYDYLAATTPAASTPTPALAAFAAGCAALGLTAPEALAALNLAPSREVEAYLVVPDLDARPVPGGAAALLALVKEHLVITPANGNGNGATTAQQEQQQPEEEQQQQQPAAED